MFPELTPAQIERIASIGERREIRAGEMLFDIGDQNARFFVVLSGAVDIVRPVGDREEPVTAHGPGQFTGEINMLSARRSLVRARVAADGTVIAVDRDDLRTLVQRDPEVSEILMRAFILRRLALMGELAQDPNAPRRKRGATITSQPRARPAERQDSGLGGVRPAAVAEGRRRSRQPVTRSRATSTIR